MKDAGFRALSLGSRVWCLGFRARGLQRTGREVFNLWEKSPVRNPGDV